MITPQVLGNRIKFFRKRAGISQLDLEIAMGAATGFISRIESGQVNPTKETVCKIAKILNLRILELEYIIGLIAEPATDEEIKLAMDDVKELFNTPGVFAYMIDDRLRLIDISKSFLEFFEFNDIIKQQIFKVNMVKLVFGKNSIIHQHLDPQAMDELTNNLLIRIYVENMFMFDDPTTMDAVNFIRNDPYLNEFWMQLEKTKPDMVVHLSRQRRVNFISNGKKIHALYSLEPLQKYPRFQVVDYVFLD